MRHAVRFGLSLVILTSAYAVVAQKPPERTPPGREVPFRLASVEIVRFEKPIRIGVGEGAQLYEEALVFKLVVDRETYDSLPPDIEPFLYIGSQELRTYHIERREGSRELILTYHAPEWQRLVEGAPMVLTTAHGALAREPEQFDDAPRFSRQLVVDRRG